MSATESLYAGQRYKLTREWGDQWASLLWDEYLGRFEVDWAGSTVLDFGCAWGYVPKYLVERAGVGAAHGVDLHPAWEAMVDGFRPDSVAGVHLHTGNVLELPVLQRMHFDVIISLGTIFLLEPSRLMSVLHWFYDHLKPGGHCLIQTRTYPHYDGADLGERAPRFAHLLFGDREIRAFLHRRDAAAPRYVNPSCAATYLAQFARAGFSIEKFERLHDGVDEAFLAEHAAKLRWLAPEELRTSGLAVLLQRPRMQDLSILDRGEHAD